MWGSEGRELIEILNRHKEEISLSISKTVASSKQESWKFTEVKCGKSYYKQLRVILEIMSLLAREKPLRFSVVKLAISSKKEETINTLDNKRLTHSKIAIKER